MYWLKVDQLPLIKTAIIARPTGWIDKIDLDFHHTIYFPERVKGYSLVAQRIINPQTSGVYNYFVGEREGVSEHILTLTDPYAELRFYENVPRSFKQFIKDCLIVYKAYRHAYRIDVRHARFSPLINKPVITIDVPVDPEWIIDRVPDFS